MRLIDETSTTANLVLRPIKLGLAAEDPENGMLEGLSEHKVSSSSGSSSTNSDKELTCNHDVRSSKFETPRQEYTDSSVQSIETANS